MRQNVLHAAFNRGRISKYGLARDDLEGNRIRYGGEVFTNLLPFVLGSMTLKPGTGYTGTSRNNAKAVHLDFAPSTFDQAVLEATDQVLRVKLDEVPITRPSVSSAVTHGDFSSATGWTNADETGGVSNITGGNLELVGTGFAAAIRKQQVTVSGGDAGKEHGLRIIVTSGPVSFRCGSTDGGDDYVLSTTLGEGTHSLSFTPTGNFWIRFSSLRIYKVVVDSCQVEAAGVMEIPTPWLEADLPSLRWQESVDVLYVGCKGYQQRKIERRGTRGWSVVLYQPEDGPFKVGNTGVTTLSASALSGNITVTASRSLFRAASVGSLYQISSVGQLAETVFTADNQFGDPIRVAGTDAGSGSARTLTVVRTGTFVATITLQRSFAAPGAWEDVPGHTFATAGSSTYDDGFNDSIVYYRLAIKTGDYTSGSVTADISIGSGSIVGVVRITAYSSDTSVSAIVLKALGGTGASQTWREGEWSTRRGFPMVPILADGRLWWGGKSKFFGSVSDAYEGFDPDTVGDAGPINRSIPAGGADDIYWMLALERLIAGGPGAEFVVRSSTLDEPLSPTLFNVKAPSDRGSAPAAAKKLGTSGIFIGKSALKLFELKFAGDGTSIDYTSDDGDLTQIIPEIGIPGFTRIAIQQYPDTRIHCMRSDGTVGLLVKDPAENVLCWVDIETDGVVEDIIVMPCIPGEAEDKVYYHINRTVNGGTVRYLERWAKKTECVGDAITKLADCFVVYDGVATNVITGLGHLEAKAVVVWADGKDLSPLDEDREPKTYTVTGGQITLDVGVTVEQAVVGLFYRGRFKGTKLAYAAQTGTAIAQRKRVFDIGLELADTHHKGLYYGRDFETMDCLPQVIEGAVVEDDFIHDELDLDMTEFPGEWSTDSRVCLEMSAPRPCTALAMVIGMETHEK